MKSNEKEFRWVDIGDGKPVKVEVCSMCGIAPGNVDDCGEFGNPECPCFGIGLEEYDRRFGSSRTEIMPVLLAEEAWDADTMVVRLTDYTARLAELESTQRALAESQANDRQAMAYLSQIMAIVGGDDFPDMVRRCARLQAKCERLQAAMIEAKPYIEHYMYGGSSYREPAAVAIAIIVDALQGDQP